MKKELLLYRDLGNGNIVPFPSEEEQISLTSFTYQAQRMAATPTITASFNYPRCLDDDWGVDVFAEYNGEKYYIRQIPSSSKDNKSVMYKHDLTLYSERFVLENIYLYDVAKNDDTNVIIRCNLIEFASVINKSFEKSNLSYNVEIAEDTLTDKRVQNIKDIALDKVYLSAALQEIYNQWGIPYYYSGTKIIVRDCSIHIKDSDVLEYGYDKSLLSIKKNNANFRKITRCSGYGSDRNIAFYYPNISQKGVIDIDKLETNTKLQKSDLIITDMRKFDKNVPLNGNVVYKLKEELLPSASSNLPELQTFYIGFGEYKNYKQNIHIQKLISFKSSKKNTYVTISFKVIAEEHFELINRSVYKDWSVKNWVLTSFQNLAYWICANINFGFSSVRSSGGTSCPTNVITTKEEVTLDWSGIGGNNCTMIRTFNVEVTTLLSDSDNFSVSETDKYYFDLACYLASNENVQQQVKIAEGGKVVMGIMWSKKDILASDSNHYVHFKLDNFSLKYKETQSVPTGWYLNNKKVELSDIGVDVLRTPNDSWAGEGFKQIKVDYIPVSQYLMPPIYRQTLGNEKFYNAKDNTYLNEDNEYYDFETEWTEVNQNEHIQPFEEIYPTITNIVNADNIPFDEILDIAFDDNDNNDVDEEGNFLHPYFYVKLPVYNGDNGFNIFDHKIVGGSMQVSFTNGDCAACVFDIMVKTRPNINNETYEDVINPVRVKSNGDIVDGDWQEKTNGDFNIYDTNQQFGNNNSIWIALKKDTETFNETYPNYEKSVIPKKDDKFVLLNIEMPLQYIESAEEKLRQNIIQYMWENNSDKWNFAIDFSRIFLQENPEFSDSLTENAKVDVKYNGYIYSFYVNDYKCEVKNTEALPKVTIELADTLSINRSIAQTIASGIMKDVQSQINNTTFLTDLDKQFLRKRYDETMPNNMTFEKNVQITQNLSVNQLSVTEDIKAKGISSFDYNGNNMLGSGFSLGIDEENDSLLVVDKILAKKKIETFEYVIQQIKSQGGIVVQSMCAIECTNVEIYDTYYRCYFDTKNGNINNQFEINDLAQSRRTGYDAKYYWRKIVGIGIDYIDLSIEECDSGSAEPAIGDTIVHFGNTTNPDRQSVIVMSVYGDNAPSIIMYSGINSFSIEDKDISGTKYVLSQTLENGENGTTEIKNGYPHFFSYGSMYFGSRDGQSNYISFQKNKDTGNFEMIINAKTTFKGSTTNISNILEENDNKANTANTNANNAVNTANTANTNANNAVNTANQTKEDLDNLSIGGENLLIGAYKYPSKDNAFSFTSDKNDDYNPLPVLSCKLEANQIYTFTAYTDGKWAELETTDDKLLQVDAWLDFNKGTGYTYMRMTNETTHNGGQTISVRKLDDGRLCATFIPTYTETYSVRFDIDYIGNTRKFWQVQVEKGSVPTDWKPAKEDTITPLYEALRGSTEIEGGLVSTNVLMVKDSNGNTTGGVNGLEGEIYNNVAFWAGGSFNDAINDICNIVIRKNGTAKIGNFIVNQDNIIIKQYDNDVYVGYIVIDKTGLKLVTVNSDSTEEERLVITSKNSSEITSVKSDEQKDTSITTISTSLNISDNSDGNTSTYKTNTLNTILSTFIISNINRVDISVNLGEMEQRVDGSLSNDALDLNRTKVSITIRHIKDDGSYEDNTKTLSATSNPSEGIFKFGKELLFTFNNVTKQSKFFFYKIHKYMRTTGYGKTVYNGFGNIQVTTKVSSFLRKTIIAKNGFAYRASTDSYLSFFHNSTTNKSNLLIKADEIEIKQGNNVIVTNS